MVAPSSSPSANGYAGNRTDVAIKITEGTNVGATHELWRESSYDFSQDAFAKGVGDFGFATDSPAPSTQRSSLSKIPESPLTTPRGVAVSFNEAVQRRSNASSNGGDGAGGGGGGGGSGDVGAPPSDLFGEVLLCSSNSVSFGRKSSLLSTKSKSRLMDPPEEEQRLETIMRSASFTGKGMVSEIDDDETFWDDDLPMEYRKLKINKWTILESVSLISLSAALICSLVVPCLKKKKLFELEYWKWEVMILVLICGRLFSGWGIRLGVFLIERNFMLRRRVLYFVYGLRKAVQNCIWLSLVLIAWLCIFDKRVERITNGKVLPYVTRIWECLLVGTIVWLLKTLIFKAMASSFHVSTFFHRIQESLFNQYVIETLSGPPLIEMKHDQEEQVRVLAEVQMLQSAGATIPYDLKANIFRPRSFIGTPKRKTDLTVLGRSHRISREMMEDDAITIEHLHRLNQKNVSAWNMKRLMKIIRKGALTTEQLHNPNGEDESTVEITNENQAKAASKKIFNNVAQLGSK